MASSPRRHHCNPSSDSVVLCLSTSAGKGGGACDKDQEEGHVIRSRGRDSRNITVHVLTRTFIHTYTP